MHKKDDSIDQDKSKAVELVDEEGEELLDINPMRKVCPICDSEVVTYVEHELSPVFYFFLLFSMFIFGWMFIFLLPFAYLLLQNAVHRCSKCLNEIGTRHMFGLPDISQDFLTLKLGKSMIVVMSKRVGIAIFSVLAIIFLYFAWIHDFGGNTEVGVNTESIEVTFPWTEFIDDCGSNVILSNNVKATDIFKKKYQNNVVNWSGFFIESRTVNRIGFGENHHAMNILIKMEPSETETDPDIVLSLSNSVYKSYQETIENLSTGDQINFNAKIIALGDEFNINHLHALVIHKTGVFKALPDIIIRESGLPTSIPEGADTPPVNNLSLGD